MISRSTRRRGFTLFELIVALAIAATLLMSGRLLIEHVAATGATIAARSAAVDSARTSAQELRSLTRNMDMVADSSSNFLGDANRAQFVSWCADSLFAQHRCQVTLAVDSVVSLTGRSQTRVLAGGHGRGVLRYLSDPRDGGHWASRWGPGIYLPIAIGVVFGSDTTVLRIGDRG